MSVRLSVTLRKFQFKHRAQGGVGRDSYIDKVSDNDSNNDTQNNDNGYVATQDKRSLEYLDRSSQAKDRKNIKQVKSGPTD